MGKKTIRASCRGIGRILADIPISYYQHQAEFSPSTDHTPEQ